MPLKLPQFGMCIPKDAAGYFNATSKGVPCVPDGCVSPSLAARVAAKSMGSHFVG